MLELQYETYLFSENQKRDIMGLSYTSQSWFGFWYFFCLSFFLSLVKPLFLSFSLLSLLIAWTPPPLLVLRVCLIKSALQNAQLENSYFLSPVSSIVKLECSFFLNCWTHRRSSRRYFGISRDASIFKRRLLHLNFSSEARLTFQLKVEYF